MVIEAKQLAELAGANSSKLEELFDIYMRINYPVPKSCSIRWSNSSNKYQPVWKKIENVSKQIIQLPYGQPIEAEKLPEEAMYNYTFPEQLIVKPSTTTSYYKPVYDISTYDPTKVGEIQVIRERASDCTVYRWPGVYNPEHKGAEILVQVLPKEEGV